MDRRDKITSFLAHQRVGVISTAGSSGMWAMPVWYRPDTGLPSKRSFGVDCLIPRWADIAHFLTEESTVVFIVQAPSSVGLRWLQIRGTARPVTVPDWSRLLPRWMPLTEPDHLYMVVRVRPTRIDLIDEDLGWGVQETLEW